MVKDLKELAEASEVASSMFKLWAKRPRSARGGVSEIRAIAREIGKPVHEVVKVLEKLEHRGVGQILKTKRGRPNKFKWSYTLRSVGKAVVGLADLESQKVRSRMVPRVLMSSADTTEKSAYKLTLRKGNILVEVLEPLEDDELVKVMQLINNI